MSDKLMYIPNDDTQNSVDYNQLLKLNKPTNQNLLKAPKVVKPTNKKTLGTGVINSPMSPPSLQQNRFLRSWAGLLKT